MKNFKKKKNSWNYYHKYLKLKTIYAIVNNDWFFTRKKAISCDICSVLGVETFSNRSFKVVLKTSFNSLKFICSGVFPGNLSSTARRIIPLHAMGLFSVNFARYSPKKLVTLLNAFPP